MDTRQYLIDTFRYNDRANRQILEMIPKLKNQEPAIRLFSHMINSMKRWMTRIVEYPNDPQTSWWDPVYSVNKLEQQWADCLEAWLKLLSSKTEDDLARDVLFVGYNKGTFAAKLQDIALQLNYHSIHHRAQIQMLIRGEGMNAPFVDYIGTVYREVK